MPDEKDPKKLIEEAEEDLDISLEEDGATYRGRGRPKLPPDLRRREKIITAVTELELKEVMIAAANDPNGPMRPQDWVRKVVFERIAQIKAGK